MSESFVSLFSFSGRRNRASYAVVSLGLVVFLVLTALPMVFGLRSGHDLAIVAGTAVTLPLWLAGIVSSWAVLAQRCRDFGWTGWAALLCLLPYGGMAFTFALAFIPGTDGPNRYGPAPF